MKTLIVLCLFCANLPAAILEWDANPEPEVIGYKVYQGGESRVYTNVVDVGSETTLELNSSPCCVQRFYAVTAYTADGLESDYSNEVTWTPRPSAPTLRIIPGPPMAVQSSNDLSNWTTIATVPASTNKQFFRTKQN